MRASAILMSLGMAAAAQAADPAALVGTWTAESAERDGGPADGLVGHRLQLSGDRFEIAGKDGRLLYAGSYTTDPATQPARIDFRHDGGEAAGQVWEGIYRLDGDSLTIVDDAPDPAKGRPTDFTAAAGSGWVLLVFVR
jgi:uncharacterized protein (TIGR03067 family)